MEQHSDEIQKCLQDHGYKVLKAIGNGGFATVYTIYSDRYNQTYCVKLMELSEERKSLPESFNAEINSLIKVIHPNVVAIYDYFQSPHMLYIILEFCNGGSLDKMILNEGKIDPPILYSMCKQIIIALLVVHGLGIAHRDIKPQNILLDTHKRPKLADFGLAQQMLGNDEKSERFSGSLPFKSPEILNMKPYDPFLADVWALGVTFYMMAFGCLPWKANTLMEWKQLVVNGCCSIPPGTNAKFAHALRMMMDPNVKTRPTLADVANFPIFAEVDLGVPRCNSKQFISQSGTLVFPKEVTFNISRGTTNPQMPINPTNKQTSSLPSLISGNQLGGRNQTNTSCVFSWKRRCSKVTRMVHMTFDENTEKEF